METFSQLESLFLDDSSLCQVDKRKKPTRTAALHPAVPIPLRCQPVYLPDVKPRPLEAGIKEHSEQSHGGPALRPIVPSYQSHHVCTTKRAEKEKYVLLILDKKTSRVLLWPEMEVITCVESTIKQKRTKMQSTCSKCWKSSPKKGWGIILILSLSPSFLPSFSPPPFFLPSAL